MGSIIPLANRLWIWRSASCFFWGPTRWGEGCLINAVLNQVSPTNILVISTEHSLVLSKQCCQMTRLFPGDLILAGFLIHTLQMVWNLRRHWGASYRPQLFPSIFCDVLLINVGECSDSETCCQLQRLIAWVNTLCYHITFGTCPINAICQHHLVTQALNQSFWSMIMWRQTTG